MAGSDGGDESPARPLRVDERRHTITEANMTKRSSVISDPHLHTTRACWNCRLHTLDKKNKATHNSCIV